VTASAVSKYYRARGAAHASVTMVAEAEVAAALHAVEAALVRSQGQRVIALTQEATRQRWPRAGSMFLLRHRAYAAAADSPFGCHYTHVSQSASQPTGRPPPPPLPLLSPCSLVIIRRRLTLSWLACSSVLGSARGQRISFTARVALGTNGRSRQRRYSSDQQHLLRFEQPPPGGEPYVSLRSNPRLQYMH